MSELEFAAAFLDDVRRHGMILRATKTGRVICTVPDGFAPAFWNVIYDGMEACGEIFAKLLRARPSERGAS